MVAGAPVGSFTDYNCNVSRFVAVLESTAGAPTSRTMRWVDYFGFGSSIFIRYDPAYADDPAYCAYEKAARDLKRGLWAAPRDQVIAPWEWRRRKTLDGQFTDYWSETVAACVSSLDLRVDPHPQR
jgi:hypothetical protein